MDRTNAWIYQNNHTKPWPQVHQNWREGYLQMLKSAEPIIEKDLLDKERYTWLHGYSPLDVLIGSYEHHQEHYEKVMGALIRKAILFPSEVISGGHNAPIGFFTRTQGGAVFVTGQA